MTTRSWPDAIKLVSPFASGDVTRPHLASPAVWEDHAVATDGHTLCAARAAGDRPGPVGSVVGNPNATPPPWEYVIPEELVPCGSFRPDLCPALEVYPASWTTRVTFRPDGQYELSATREWPSNTKRKPVHPIASMSVREWFPGIAVTYPVAIDVHYLWRVAELWTGPKTRGREIHVFRTASGNDCDPWVFATVDTPRTRADLLALDSFTIVMPVRI